MDRQRATELIELVLRNLDAQLDQWPLSLTTEVYVFGSFARGALDPHDVDLDIEHETPWEWATKSTSLYMRGKDPHSLFRTPLLGRRRGCQALFNFREQADFEMTLLWQRGDSLDVALGRLGAIPADPAAGRAPREAMRPEFEGLDRWLPLFVREEISHAMDIGAVAVERLQLPDAAVADRAMAEYLADRWSKSSPLHRAAAAVLGSWQERGIDPGTAHLHGQDVGDGLTPHFAGFGLRYFEALPWCLTEHHGVEWLEVVHPTRTLPLECLRFTPLDQGKLAELHWQ